MIQKQSLYIAAIACIIFYSSWLWSGGKGQQFQHQTISAHRQKNKNSVSAEFSKHHKRKKRSLEDIKSKELKKKTEKWINSITGEQNRSQLCLDGFSLGKGTRERPVRLLTMEEVLGHVDPTNNNGTIHRSVASVKQNETLYSACVGHHRWMVGGLRGYSDGPVSDIVDKWKIKENSKTTPTSRANSATTLPIMQHTLLMTGLTTESMNGSNGTTVPSAGGSSATAPSLLMLTAAFLSLLK